MGIASIPLLADLHHSLHEPLIPAILLVAHFFRPKCITAQIVMGIASRSQLSILFNVA
jgi:hypothetical protein